MSGWSLRMRDLPIRVKTAFILLPMAAAAMTTGGWSLNTAVQSAQAAQRTQALVRLAGASADLAHELQTERAALAALLLPDAGQQVAAAYGQQVERTRQRTEAWRSQAVRVSDPPVAITAIVGRVGDGLADLDAQRSRLADGKPAALSGAMFAYRIIVADLLAYQDAAAQAGVDPVLADQIRAAAALARATEAVGQQQVSVLQALALGQLTPSLSQDIAAARSAYDEGIKTFTTLGVVGWRVELGRQMTGAAVLDAVRLEGVVSRTPVYQRVETTAKAWTAAMGARAARLRQVEIAVHRDITTAVAVARDAQIRIAVLQASLTVAAVLAALLIGIVVARHTTRRLRRLETEAGLIGTARLPELKDALGTVTTREDARKTMQRFAGSRAITVTGRDEIGRLAAALGGLLGAAETALAGEAGNRATAGEATATIARRGAGLVEDIIHRLDEVERDADSELLAKLFDVDQGITQMRRFQDNLQVLAEHGLSKIHSEDEDTHDVLTAAGQEVEEYERIRFGAIAQSQIRAAAVPATVVVLRELLDNAIRYSPGDSPIEVSARWADGGLHVTVRDTGMGIASETLAHFNLLLAGRVAYPEQPGHLGLTVSGIVAAQYGLPVWLEAAQPGISASVLVPNSYVLRMAADRRPALSGGPRAALARAADHTATLPTVGPPAWPTPAPHQVPSSWMNPDLAEPVIEPEEPWRAAAQAPVVAGTTRSGLPRRNPAEVSGRVPPPAAPTNPRALRIDPQRQSQQVAAVARALAAVNHHRPTRGDIR
ncbi:nitrate- and nitrite sensing domain-containing protein [Hamadaea sp. NPDC050747]|uniref:sensor histidine kinase n=1 Tax=Hamadaea sp. NPDC050747 TaxID=3155789 RepID=UPI0033F72CF7